MMPFQYQPISLCQLALVINFLGSANSASITGTERKGLEVYVSAAAIIQPLNGVKVFTDEQEITFLIPDLPSLPPDKSYNCPPGASWCGYINDIHHVEEQTSNLLNVLHQAFTYDGISKAPASDSSNKNVDQTNPNYKQELANSAGQQWYSDMILALEDRKLDGEVEFSRRRRSINSSTDIEGKENGNQTDPNARGRRGAFGTVVKTGIAVGVPILLDFIKDKLFVPDHAIADKLAELKSKLPEQFKVFADLPTIQSSFTATRKVAAAVVKFANKNFAQEFSINNGKFGSTISDWITATNFNQMSSSNSVNHLALLVGHFSALSDCRDGNVHLVFVPPAVLEPQLVKLEKKLDPSLEMVVPSKESSMYYTMQCAKCKFDNDGGIVQVKIPIKPKKSVFTVYQYKSLSLITLSLTWTKMNVIPSGQDSASYHRCQLYAYVLTIVESVAQLCNCCIDFRQAIPTCLAIIA